MIARAFGIAALCAAIGCLIVAGTAAAQPANSDAQIILSGIGFDPAVGPLGFWLWSQPATNNAYGPDGQGDMYFYGLGLNSPVEIRNISVTGWTVTEEVVSKKGLFDCWISATETQRQGNQNGTFTYTSCTSSVVPGISAVNGFTMPAKVSFSNFTG